MTSSDETYLEAYIEQLTTSQWTYQIRRTMDLIRDLDRSCDSDLETLQQLSIKLHTQIEQTLIQNFDIVELNESDSDEVPEDAPDEIDEIFGWNNSNKPEKDLSTKKRKRPQYGMRLVASNGKTDAEKEPAMIPTTEELLEYVLRQPVTSTPPFASTSATSVDKNSTATLKDLYQQMQELQQNCVQKTHEKVYVAQQAFEMIDAQVQRLDSDIHSMELLLQVRLHSSSSHAKIVRSLTCCISHSLLFRSPPANFLNRNWVSIPISMLNTSSRNYCRLCPPCRIMGTLVELVMHTIVPHSNNNKRRFVRRHHKYLRHP